MTKNVTAPINETTKIVQIEKENVNVKLALKEKTVRGKRNARKSMKLTKVGRGIGRGKGIEKGRRKEIERKRKTLSMTMNQNGGQEIENVLETESENVNKTGKAEKEKETEGIVNANETRSVIESENMTEIVGKETNNVNANVRQIDYAIGTDELQREEAKEILDTRKKK